MTSGPTSATSPAAGASLSAPGQSSARASAGSPGGDPAGALREFLDDLLGMQCRLVGAVAGIVYLVGGSGRPGGVFCRYAAPGARAPSLESAGSRLDRLIESACRAGGEGGGAGMAEIVRFPGGSGLYGDEPSHPVLASPLRAAGRVEGCSIVVLPEVRGGRLPAETDDALSRLALAALRFETYLWQQHALGEAHQKAMLGQTLELLDASQQGQNAAAMGAMLCHELARRFGCARVSIGLIGRGDRLRIVAVSGTDQVDRKGSAAEAIEAAMEECAAQDIEVVYPAPESSDPGERRVVRAHDALSKKFGPSAIVSLPLRVEGDLVGVVLLEREAADPFPPGSAPLLRLVAEFIGPAIWTRRLADRGIIAVARDRVRTLGAAIVGPRHTGAKLAGLTLLGALAAAALVPIPGRVVATASIEAESRRTIVPPFAGYLADVSVRPGDEVRAGAVLAEMDTQAILLDRDESLARREAIETQRDDALSRRELDKVRTASAQIAEINARLRFLDDQLARATIVAPINGRIARGDQRDFVGARVEPGQPLFEVIDDRRLVAVMVDERDITRVAPGMRGWIAPRARPDQRASIEVVRINPVAQTEARANVYRVEATVEGEAPDWLRPGASAVAKLDDRPTTALRLFLRPIVEEIRLSWWW